jgi:ABC-type amino acid transport substrate-binding protein
MTTIILDMHDKIVVVVIFIADSSSADYLTQIDSCDLEVTGLPFSRTEFEIAVPKNWAYKDDLDHTILKLKETSAIDDLLAKWFQQKKL